MKTAIPHAEAMIVAKRYVAMLTPYCHRIAIAGSLRRKKPTVGDVEILYAPKCEDRQADFFTTEPIDLAHEAICTMLTNGVIAKRPSAIGVFTFGSLNKHCVDAETGISVDFFCEPNPLDWWRSLAARTGPKETSVALMTNAKLSGRTAHAYGIGLTDQTGARVPVESERDFFEKCNVEYVEPEDRK